MIGCVMRGCVVIGSDIRACIIPEPLQPAVQTCFGPKGKTLSPSKRKEGGNKGGEGEGSWNVRVTELG